VSMRRKIQISRVISFHGTRVDAISINLEQENGSVRWRRSSLPRSASRTGLAIVVTAPPNPINISTIMHCRFVPIIDMLCKDKLPRAREKRGFVDCLVLLDLPAERRVAAFLAPLHRKPRSTVEATFEAVERILEGQNGWRASRE
jgi:hypothetical protein